MYKKLFTLVLLTAAAAASATAQDAPASGADKTPPLVRWPGDPSLPYRRAAKSPSTGNAGATAISAASVRSSLTVRPSTTPTGAAPAAVTA